MPAEILLSHSGIMANNYQKLWMDAINAKGEAKAVQILAEILADKEGRNFVSNLGPKDAEFCIELLDRVSRGLFLFSPFIISDGFTRASQSTTSKPQKNSISLLR